MATRVFELARELGVKSKEIITRCKAEGIPGIDNHMTTVSIGLSESIRGWFGHGADAEQTQTAVSTLESPAKSESAGKKTTASGRSVTKRKIGKAVARKKAVKKTTKATGAAADKTDRVEARRRVARAHPGERGSAAARRTAESRAGSTESPRTKRAPAPHDRDHSGTIKTPESKPGDEQVIQDRAEDTAAPLAPGATTDSSVTVGDEIDSPIGQSTVIPATAASESTEDGTAKSTEEADAKRSVPNVPQRPDVVGPAGPQLDVQTPAKLSGPKVVRIEEADIIDKPRSRPRSSGPTVGGRGVGPVNGGQGAGPADVDPGSEGGVSRRNTRRKSRGAGDRTGIAANRGRSGQSGRFAGGGGPTGRLHNWNEQDLIERQERLRGSRGFIRTLRRGSKGDHGGGERARSARETGGVVKIQEPFTIKDLSAATGVKASDILKALMNKGLMTTVNAGIDVDLAMEIMLEYEIELDVEEKMSAEDLVAEKFEHRESVDIRPRLPVITILGHVDHGKTSLLDRIRRTNVADGEAGGITQHTSAFRVKIRGEENSKQLVFLDTPGHEAFTAMRARGAQVTDIVILVVAADDGVMPQTIESINHAKAAEVPIIVALNKIDKPEATDANLQRIYGQLAEYDLAPAEWGGQTDVIKCSATIGEGIQDILDTIDIQAEIMELTADFGGLARGTVLEAKMMEGRGPVANLLVREGEMKVGDFIAVGRAFGRVRDITNDQGEKIEVAGPSTPVEISGLDRLPDAGDSFYIVDSIKMAQESASHRLAFEREKTLAAPKVTLDNIFTTIDERARCDLNLIVKADAQGSIETLKKTLEEISTDEIHIRVLHAAVGGITESDVILAEASGAIILGFHVIASHKARIEAERKHIEIRNYQVIYELLDDVRKAASGLLAPEIREEVLGHAEVREVFRVSKVGMVAGCYVTDGVVRRAAKIRVTRQDIVIENNRVLEQLKRFKDDAKEVRAGQECGMKIEGYDDIKSGDVIECYAVTEVAREL